MKNFYSLLFLLAAGLTVNSQSYLFSQDSSQYNEFTDGSTLNTELWDDEEFTVDLGFEFDAFEYSVSQVTVSANGVITIDNGNETEDVQLGLFFTDLVDGSFSSDDFQTIHIQTKSEGDVGNRKFTIQWDNAAVWGAQEAYLDLQIILYETGDVSVQFGTNFQISSFPNFLIRTSFYSISQQH